MGTRGSKKGEASFYDDYLVCNTSFQAGDHEFEVSDLGYSRAYEPDSWSLQPLTNPSYEASSYGASASHDATYNPRASMPYETSSSDPISSRRSSRSSSSRHWANSSTTQMSYTTSYPDQDQEGITLYARRHRHTSGFSDAIDRRHRKQHYEIGMPDRLGGLSQSDVKDNRLAVATEFAAKRATPFDRPLSYSRVVLETETEGRDSVPSELAVFDPKLIEEALSRFSRTIVKQLSITTSYSPLDNAARHILADLEQALEKFSESFYLDKPTPSCIKAAELIGQRIIAVASHVLEILIRKDVSIKEEQESGQTSVTWQKDEDNMKATTGSSSDNFPFPLFTSYPFTPKDLEPESWRLNNSGNGPETYINPVGALEDLTKRSPFKALLRQIEHILDCYAKQKLDTIRHRMYQCLRGQNSSYEEGVHRHRIVFKIPWDLEGFLKDNYKNKKDREIGKVASVTGAKDNAILCSVAEYFAEQWPSLPEFLLEAIMSSLEYYARPEVMARKNKSNIVTNTYIRPTGNPPPNSHVFSCVISFNPTLQELVAEGPEEFIISIAQQISWLSAVCQQKLDCLSCAYVGLRAQSGSYQTNSAEAVFEIDIQLKKLVPQDSTSCWNSLVGPAVIVSGFPVPQRKNGVHGLEISVPGMAAMAGIPAASSFDGGFIFKARHHALIPVRKLEESVQWHMLSTYPKRLDWSEIKRLCPVRLTGDIEEYAKLRSFVGYYPTVLDLIGELELVHNILSPVRSVADQCN